MKKNSEYLNSNLPNQKLRKPKVLHFRRELCKIPCTAGKIRADNPVATQWMHNTVPYFKLKFSLGFITSCYVIFSLSMVQAMDIFIIT